MLERLSYDAILTLYRGIDEICEARSYPSRKPLDLIIRRSLVVAGVTELIFFAIKMTGRNVSSVASAGLFAFRLTICFGASDMFHISKNKPIDHDRLKRVRLTTDFQWIRLAASMLGTGASLANATAGLYVRNGIGTVDALNRFIRRNDK